MGGEGQIHGFKSRLFICSWSNLANENTALGESEGGVTPTEIVEISSKKNYVYKSIQKIFESGTELKSGLYLFSPNKSFPLGIVLFSFLMNFMK